MAELAIFPDDAIEILPLHFDVPAHYVPLATFVRTAESVNGLIAALNQQAFGGALQYELLILPPEAGTFKSRLGVWFKWSSVGVAALFTFLGSDIGKAFVKGLTGHEPAYYAEIAGQKAKQAIDAVGEAVQTQAKAAESAEGENLKVGASIIVEVTKSFLQKDNDTLKTIGIGVPEFREAYSSKNEFYHACLDDHEIKAVGFSEDDNFPIKRSDFPRLCIDLPPSEPEQEIDPWQVGIETLRVTSPNWERDDQSNRQWKGKDERGKDRLFVVEDEGFWRLAKADLLDIHAIDTMRVQWAFHGSGNRKKNFRVLRVIEYNKKHLADALDDNALNAILGSFGHRAPSHHPNLFNYGDGDQP